MLPTLNTEEIRIIGCLVEKSVVTPDQYPLTLNSLTNACNQKSGRQPVMSLTKGEVQRTCRLLHGKSLVRVDENFRSGVEKYSQRLCNTRFSDFHFSPPQLALICALLLRGAQTPGELRTHCRRLHEFPDNGTVLDTLQTLIRHEPNPVVQQLPRTPGRKDAAYMHLFAGPVDPGAYASQAGAAAAGGKTERIDIAELARRIEKLEAEVAELKRIPGARS